MCDTAPSACYTQAANLINVCPWVGVGALYTQGEVGAFIPTSTHGPFIESATMDNTRLFALDLENDEATSHWPELQECLGAVDLAMRWPQGRPPAPGDEQCDDNPGLPTIGA